MKRKELNPQYSNPNRSKFNPYRLISIVILIFLALFAVIILTAPSSNQEPNSPAEYETNSNPSNQSEEIISYEDYAYLSQKIDHYTNYTAEDITVSYSNYNSQDGVMIAEGTYIRNGYMIEYKALVYDNGNYEINEY